MLRQCTDQSIHPSSHRFIESLGHKVQSCFMSRSNLIVGEAVRDGGQFSGRSEPPPIVKVEGKYAAYAVTTQSPRGNRNTEQYQRSYVTFCTVFVSRLVAPRLWSWPGLESIQVNVKAPKYVHLLFDLLIIDLLHWRAPRPEIMVRRQPSLAVCHVRTTCHVGFDWPRRTDTLPRAFGGSRNLGSAWRRRLF